MTNEILFAAAKPPADPETEDHAGDTETPEPESSDPEAAPEAAGTDDEETAG